MRTQHVQDTGIAACISGYVPHGPWGEDGAVISSSLLQVMTDVG
jgi:hypothetical protein